MALRYYADLTPDEEFKQLRSEGFLGSLNDMIAQKLVAEGYDFPSISDGLFDLVDLAWLLENGFWDDNEIWVDSATWKD